MTINLNASNALSSISLSGANNEMTTQRNIRKTHHPSVDDPIDNFLQSISFWACVSLASSSSLLPSSSENGVSSSSKIVGGFFSDCGVISHVLRTNCIITALKCGIPSRSFSMRSLGKFDTAIPSKFLPNIINAHA